LKLTLPVKSIGLEKKLGMIKYHVRTVKPAKSATELVVNSSMRDNVLKSQKEVDDGGTRS